MSKFAALVTALCFIHTLALRPRKGGVGKKGAKGKVVTLGDSYSSGTGIHKSASSYDGGACLRDHKTIPGAQYASAEGMNGINVACAGDELPGVIQQFSELQATYTEDVASDWEGSVILLTIGGNDIRTHKGENWGQLLGSCVASFGGACHEQAENQVANFDDLQARLTQFYKTVAKGASKAKIRILGYPRLLRRGWHCISVPGLAAGAAHWADDMVDVLNSRISQAVTAARRTNPGVDLEFVDVVNFLTKGACSTGGNHVHAIVLADGGLSPMTFHPHQRGYNAYYDALGSSLGRGMPPSQVPPGSPEPWEVENMFAGWDTDKNGKLDVGEVLSMGGDDASTSVSKHLRALFGEADKDKDGSLSQSEFQNLLAIVAADEDEA